MSAERLLNDASLHFRRGPFLNETERSAYERLLNDVLDWVPVEAHGASDPWMPIALFDGVGVCVGNIDVAQLPLFLDGRLTEVAAIRSVAVAPNRRGQGLFRALMQEALAWCDAHAPSTILYTAEPRLYTGYGFVSVPQHAFVGRVCASKPATPARKLDLAIPADKALILAALKTRAPLSTRCSLKIDAATFLRNVNEPDLTIAHAENLAAVLVYETSDETLSLLDVLAERIPHLDQIAAAIDVDVGAVRVMFAPDRLGWTGTPEPDETGLMLRGVVPIGWAEPFMIAPAAEF